jgi:hypothetical protein
VNEGYGAKQMVRRFSIERIVDAIARASFPGLDLSHVDRGWDRQAQAAEQATLAARSAAFTPIGGGPSPASGATKGRTGLFSRGMEC